MMAPRVVRDAILRTRPMPLLFSRRTILAHGAALAASTVTPSLFTSVDASAQGGEPDPRGDRAHR
jgi:hypothetical protein